MLGECYLTKQTFSSQEKLFLMQKFDVILLQVRIATILHFKHKILLPIVPEVGSGSFFRGALSAGGLPFFYVRLR
jgi:hypothetical protein